MRGSTLRKMFSHYKNWPLVWQECCGNHCSPWLEAEVSRGFCDLWLYSSKPCLPPCQHFPSIPILDVCFSPEKWFSLPQSLGAFRQNRFLPPCPHPHRHVALLAPTSSNSSCSDLLGACQRPFVTGLEKNNKAALPSNLLRNVKTGVGTHGLFVTSGTLCQLPSLAGGAKWQNTMKRSTELHRASQDRGCILLKNVTLCLLPNWGNFLPFSILPSILDLYILMVFARAHLKKAILQ